MIEVARINVTYTGGTWKTTWTVEASAHAVGVSVARGTSSFRCNDDLGTPFGAERAATHLLIAAGRLGDEFMGAWSTPPLF